MIEAEPGDLVVISRTQYRRLRCLSGASIIVIAALADNGMTRGVPAEQKALEAVALRMDHKIDNASNIFMIGAYLCKDNKGLSIVTRKQGMRYDFMCRNGAQFLRQTIHVRDSAVTDQDIIAQTELKP